MAAKLLPEPVLVKAEDELIVNVAVKIPGIITKHYEGIRGVPGQWKWKTLDPTKTAPPLTCCDITNAKNLVLRRMNAEPSEMVQYRRPENMKLRGLG